METIGIKLPKATPLPIETKYEKTKGENIMRNFEKLCDLYIKETKASDGQKFCGCRADECDNYSKITKCRKCLKDALNNNEL